MIDPGVDQEPPLSAAQSRVSGALGSLAVTPPPGRSRSPQAAHGEQCSKIKRREREREEGTTRGEPVDQGRAQAGRSRDS